MQTKQQNEPGTKKKRSLLLVLAILVFVCVIAVGCILNYASAAQNNRKAAQVSEQCSEIQAENEEMKGFLDEENHDAYYDKVAREQYGYAKPGERVFYYDASDN